jgi:hypothetical protein
MRACGAAAHRIKTLEPTGRMRASLPAPVHFRFFLAFYGESYSRNFIPRRNHGRSRQMTSKLCGICDANTRRGSAQLLHKSACQFVAAILRYQRPSGAPASPFLSKLAMPRGAVHET